MVALFMRKWECYRCSFIFEGDNPPEECPSCHYSTTFWLEYTVEKPLTVKNYLLRNFLMMEDSKTAWEAARLLRDKNARGVVVISDGKPVGNVTLRDIVEKVDAEDLQASKVRLTDMMSPKLISVSPDTQYKEALKIMDQNMTRCLLVTEKEKLIGIVIREHP